VAIKAYLAGPDVFLPDAHAHARRKVEICAQCNVIGLPPLNEDVQSLSTRSDADAWQSIFRKDLAMMEECDIIIANLTPFRGPSADAGTLIEVGWFLGRGKPIFGYSNSAASFAERNRDYVAAIPDVVPGIAIDGFGLPDNLMIPGAVSHAGGHPLVLPLDGQDRPLDALDVFRRCVELAASMTAGGARL
jgi:nucleoside 2-deoxyribosyltransferase